MGWGRANSTQAALAAAEQHFVDICDTEDEVSEEDVEAAYEAMQRRLTRRSMRLDRVSLDGLRSWLVYCVSVVYVAARGDMGRVL